MKEYKYYCEDCQAKFRSEKAICPNCESKNVAIDELVIRVPKLESIVCRKCGDEVDVPTGKKICWQCTEEGTPFDSREV